MASVESQIAAWMLHELEEAGTLYQEHAALHIAGAFGEPYVYYNDNGGLAISPKVLRAFRKISETRAVWVRTELYWRLRTSMDQPGRQSDY